MNKVITLSIVVALLPTIAVAHWLKVVDGEPVSIVIVPPVPTTVVPGETIDVVFNYTTEDTKVPRDHAGECPWRVRLDSVNPTDGPLLGLGTNWHSPSDPIEKTFNVVASVTIPPDTTIESHNIVVWASTDYWWSWPASDLIIQSYVIPIQVVSPVLTVVIDIKPGSDPNPINQGSNGLIPVAIFSSTDFDATTVIPESISLGGAEVAVRGKGDKYMAHEEDVNEDGITDLVVQVETEGLDEVGEQGEVILTGETTDGKSIEGYDVVVIVPPE